jgi:hypothetical protein
MKTLTGILLFCSCILNAETVLVSNPEKKEALSSHPPQSSYQAPSSYMRIEPHARALDYQQAFEQLRKEKTSGKVYFQLTNGTMISNIIDMALMPNSTLILFRFNSSQGIKFQTVKVEEIASLNYQ